MNFTTNAVRNMGLSRIKAAGLAALAAGMLVAGCSPTTNVRGHVIEPRMVEAIRPGVDDQASVKAMLGTPSVMGTFSDKRWYYVSRTTEQLAFFKPDVLEQKIVMVDFDDSGIVRNVRNIDLAEAEKIDPVDDETPTRGRELGFWEQIFGNIGRFSGGAPAR
jgi:outer membrane protein assembly factor BamE (lipoprotein component of BamABCDE complex)